MEENGRWTTREGSAIDPGSEDLKRWVEQSHAGDGEAQQRLIDAVEDLVRAVARRTVRDPHDREDLTQSIYLAIFRGLATYRGEAHFRAWLAAVARNEARKFLRTRIRREEPVRDAERDVDRLAGPRPSDPLETRQLREALGRLAADDREALERVVFDGLSYEEAGRTLGCSAGSVRGRVYRARRALRNHLERR